ncbi:LpqB family beta-propeller domain-containing protein [Streptomyces cavernae]|uniref:LpqB family beta-propeller domain-containing protein n=1 Tax=Streptomyces cavernae TaxID=2259034 RepID=UPI001EE3F212|nr:LpqB family beta-propeller domain-containing protein [Streptomyces cavernae]
MGAEQGRRRRTLRAAAYIGCGALLLGGCASMPDNGDLRDVDASQRPDPQVRVVAVPPRDKAGPTEIVQGFLEALVSDEPRYETARKYLTKKASAGWRPDDSVTVLADGPNTVAQPGGARDGDNENTYELRGTKVARVDAQNAYSPDDSSYKQAVHLSLQDVPGMSGKQWRIDVVPQGVVMGKSDFERIYVSVNKYYFTSDTTDATSGQLATVADPVYVRDQVDPLTEMVRSLLEGPTKWLRPVARSSFPEGTTLKSGVTSLTPDDQGKLKVQLNSKADGVVSRKCDRMAAQLLFTLQNLTPTGVDEVELQRSNGTQLCVLTNERAAVIASHGTGREPNYQYFLDPKGQLVRVPGGGNDTDPEPVPGALGEGSKPLRSAAVALDEDSAAGVSVDGHELYVGSLVSGSSLGEPVLESKSKSEKDGLATPSWDVRGDLWVADRDPEDPRLLLLEKGAGEPIQVRTPGLEGRVQAVRVAADGIRIALIVNDGGRTSLQIGRIQRQTSQTGGSPVVTVHDPRPAAPHMEEVTAMSWAGDSRLVVVGRESGGVQQMRYVQCDGSTPDTQPPSALTGVKEIAASDDEGMPLVAHSEDGIVRLSSGAQWQKMVDGTAPVYPG